MRNSNYIGILAGLIMILAAAFPWIYITSLDAVLTGFGSEKITRFGMPVLMNLFMIGLAIIFFLVPKLWAKRANPFVGAINFAWALRNLLLLSTCRNGECPQTTVWLYVYFAASLILLVMTVLPDMKVIEKK